MFHTAIVLLNTFGWMFRPTRRLSLIMLALTALSWFGMGIWYGWGYCLCTDWHHEVRRAMGIHDATHTYIQLLLLKLTGIVFPQGPVEDLTGVIYFVSLFGAVYLTVRDLRRQTGRARAKGTPGGGLERFS